jgi:DNA recombination protein RmuC
MPAETAYLLIGLAGGAALGGAAAWIAATSGAKQREAEAVAEAEAAMRERLIDAERAASGSESLITELRAQIAQHEATASALRASLNDARTLGAEEAVRVEQALAALAEQRKFVEQIEQKLGETFKSISLEALSRNADEFLKLGVERLKGQTEMGAKELEGKKRLIDQSIEGMGAKLREMQARVEQIGANSIEKIGQVTVSIQHHAEATTRLTETTALLKETLASSKKRGEWGERMAEDVIRLTGLVEGINYIKQKSLEDSARRPDFTFMLPNHLKINMDVKFPLDNYVKLLEAENDADRKRCSDELVRSTRAMLKSVTSRQYIDPASGTVDYMIVFIPNEQVYAYLNEADMALMDEALRQKVVLCSPFTLYAVLAVIRQAVDNFNLERTASEILELLADFTKQWGAYTKSFEALGKQITTVHNTYSDLAGVRTRQLEKPLRKIDALRQKQNIAMDEIPLTDALPAIEE